MQRVRLERELDKEIIEREQTLKKLMKGNEGSPTTGKIEPEIEIHIIDRSILEDNEIFAKNQRDSGMMTEEEYQQYLEVYHKNIEEIISPDLVIIMSQDAKVLHERVMKRGREMEKDMGLDYLENLNNRYINSLEPMLKSRNVCFYRQEADGPKDIEGANRTILETVNTKLHLVK